MVMLVFDREQEREADKLGLSYMVKAGYRAEGAVTLQQKLQNASSSVSIPFLNTHPSGVERISYLKELADIQTPPP